MKSDTGKRRDATRTKHAILQAAIAEFAANGPAGTRVDEIAVRASVNKSLIYQYFGSKQELYAEALNSVLSGITERSAEHSRQFAEAAARGDLFSNARAFLDNHLSMLEAMPEWPRLLAWENLEGGKTLARLPLQSTYQVFLKRAQVMLRPLAESGMLRAGFEIRHIAQAVMALTHFFLVYRGTLEHLFQHDMSLPATRDGWLDYCTHLMLANIKASEPAPGQATT